MIERGQEANIWRRRFMDAAGIVTFTGLVLISGACAAPDEGERPAKLPGQETEEDAVAFLNSQDHLVKFGGVIVLREGAEIYDSPDESLPPRRTMMGTPLLVENPTVVGRGANPDFTWFAIGKPTDEVPDDPTTITLYTTALDWVRISRQSGAAGVALMAKRETGRCIDEGGKPHLSTQPQGLQQDRNLGYTTYLYDPLEEAVLLADYREVKFCPPGTGTSSSTSIQPGKGKGVLVSPSR